MSGRKLAFLRPISWIVLGAAVLALPFIVEPKDEFGLFFGLAFGVACVGVGAFQFWRLKKDDPKTTAYTVDDLPIEQRVTALQRLMLLFGAAILVGTLMTGYELVHLEYGGAKRAAVWAPVAGLYNFVGFWPAVLFFPALGVFGITAMVRKMRVLKKAQDQAQPDLYRVSPAGVKGYGNTAEVPLRPPGIADLER
jgi:hypothetical protein